MYWKFEALLLLGLAFIATARPQAASTTTSSSATACTGNTASERTAWCDLDISTDYSTEVVDTGVTREYWFELTVETVAPDGYERQALTVNGSIPGPTIEADWGDTVVVHVTNSLGDVTNGTSIHWHGIRQNWTNQMDGVSSITQCPTAPGDSYTYTWKAEQYGTTWYHSHWALQAWEGIFGGIVINGPASANYDEDMGIVFLNDWSHQTVDELYLLDEQNGPQTLDNGLINGTNVYGDDDSSDQTGSRFEYTWTSGTSYRMRLVNGAIDTHWKVMLDNHTMTVIAADLVPIVPYETTVLNVAIGQRYDVIITADQASVASDFWLRAVPQVACSDNDSSNNIKGIIHYDSSTSTPTTSAYDYVDGCVDEAMASLVPYVSKTVDSPSFWTETETVSVAKNSAGLNRWRMNSTSMVVEWSDPTLLQVYNDDLDFTNTSGVVELDDADEWAYFVIEGGAVSHPIHLHGHDFFILAQGSGTWNTSVTLDLDNPPRRDTATMPLSGYLVIAFQTDNPGGG